MPQGQSAGGQRRLYEGGDSPIARAEGTARPQTCRVTADLDPSPSEQSIFMITPSQQFPCVCECTYVLCAGSPDCRKYLPPALSPTTYPHPQTSLKQLQEGPFSGLGIPGSAGQPWCPAEGAHALLCPQPVPLSILDSGSPVPLCCPVLPSSEPHSLSCFSPHGSSWTGLCSSPTPCTSVFCHRL